MDFYLFEKVFSVGKMENRKDRLQHDVGDKDEFYKDPIVVNKGKGIVQKKTQGKYFQPIEFTDSMPSAYEEDSTSDEDFIAEPKVIWVIKNREAV